MKRLSLEQKQAAADCMNKFIAIAEKKANRSFPKCRLEWFTGRREAGLAYITQDKIGLNEILMVENFDLFIADTIPHEVAHMVEYWIHGGFERDSMGRELAHGKRWKHIMKFWFKVNPSTFHNMSIKSAAKLTYFDYVCKCGCKLEISQIIHRKILNGSNRVCKKHKQKIILKTEFEKQEKEKKNRLDMIKESQSNFQSLPKGFQNLNL